VKDYDPTAAIERWYGQKETKDQIWRPRLSGETEEESRDVGRITPNLLIYMYIKCTY
jgi:hypothetical protein